MFVGRRKKRAPSAATAKRDKITETVKMEIISIRSLVL